VTDRRGGPARAAGDALNGRRVTSVGQASVQLPGLAQAKESQCWRPAANSAVSVNGSTLVAAGYGGHERSLASVTWNSAVN
jgi:hypothetical protein